jgi:hypothetical protein
MHFVKLLFKIPSTKNQSKEGRRIKRKCSRYPAKELQDRSPLQGLLRGRSCEKLSKPLLRSQSRVAASTVFKAIFVCQDTRQLIGVWIQSKQNVHLHSRRVLFLSATWVAFWLYCECSDSSTQLYVQPCRGWHIMYVEVGPSADTYQPMNCKSTKYYESRN